MAQQVAFTVYQINQKPLSAGAGNGPIRMSFASAAVLLRDCTNSPTRSLSTGVNVYTAIQVPNTSIQGNSLYYVQEQIAVVIAAMNA